MLRSSYNATISAAALLAGRFPGRLVRRLRRRVTPCARQRREDHLAAAALDHSPASAASVPCGDTALSTNTG
jgi:hypothetical protein